MIFCIDTYPSLILSSCTEISAILNGFLPREKFQTLFRLSECGRRHQQHRSFTGPNSCTAEAFSLCQHPMLYALVKSKSLLCRYLSRRLHRDSMRQEILTTSTLHRIPSFLLSLPWCEYFMQKYTYGTSFIRFYRQKSVRQF